MSIAPLVLGLFAAITVVGGLLLALARNLIHAAFLLFVVLFGVAGLYVFAHAEFLAVAQVIVYVGGILILLIFGVMLTNKLRALRPGTGFVNVLPALLASLALFFALAALITALPDKAPALAQADDVKAIGMATLTHYLLPFELVSILLLAVLMGAAYLSRRNPALTTLQHPHTHKEAGQ